MHFSLVLIDHPRHGLVKAFDNTILPISFGLRRLGYEVEILRHRVNPRSRNIIFGSANDPAMTGLDVPADSVVLNFEQLAADNSVWNGQAYLEHLRQFTVWDYSRRNIEYLSAHGIEAAHLALGYVPEMTRLRADFPAGYDVLFYGLVSPRRQAVLDDLKTLRVSVNLPPVGTFGRERDLAIVDSRLALNIHHYIPSSLEVGRLGYLWANRRPVVSEWRPDTEIPPGLEDACAYCRYEDLTSTTMELLADESKRRAQAEAGFAAFSTLSLEKSLESLVGRRQGTGWKAATGALSPPEHLHVGSGKDFRNEALNIDIDPGCRPDLVLDIARPLAFDAMQQTDRFGEIKLLPGTFAKITAFDILQEVVDPTQAMSNFLILLQDGGELVVSVPSDMSLMARAHPLTQHLFYERGFDWHTKDVWSIGWRDAKLELVDSSLILSDFGRKMMRCGVARKKLHRMPQAVEKLHLTFRKRCRTDEERRQYDMAFNQTNVDYWMFFEEHSGDAQRAKALFFNSPQARWKLRLKLLIFNAHYGLVKYFNKDSLTKAAMKQERALMRELLK